MANETKPVTCGRCKYVTEVPADLLPEFNGRECIIVQSGGKPDEVCRRYTVPNGPNRPFADTKYF